MFQGLRTNSLFYVLDKGENPNLRIGQVVSVSNPQTKYPTFNNGFTPQPMETVVDVKVKLGDEEVDFKQLPANGQIANDKNLVVSDNKDAMSAEVDEIIPISKGGSPYDKDNVQLTHRCCNRRKSNKMVIDRTANRPIPKSRDW